MSDVSPPSRRSVPPPVSIKARSERVQRLKRTLDQRLDNPIVALDALMLEAAEGERHVELWEELHAVAVRDDVHAALGQAYIKAASGPRMRQLEPHMQVEVLMHAESFFQHVLGDEPTAENFLERVLQIMPSHADAFERFERRLEKLLDGRRLLELWAEVAATPPRPAVTLATQALHRLLPLPPQNALSDTACVKLVQLVPECPRLLDAIEAHCRATKRLRLACTVLERALMAEEEDEAIVADRRARLASLYIAEVGTPELAISHVEHLLERAPSDANAIRMAERLLSTREVASRAAAALQAARRARGT